MIDLFIALVFWWQVIDGDTIEVKARVWPHVAIEGARVRLARIDTPELRSTKLCERELALKAKDQTYYYLVNAKKIEIRVPSIKSMDSFGRILGDVYVDGQSVSDLLLASGLARPYPNTISWC